MTELELRQMFKNLSDCYADTGRFENDGSYTEGEVIQAMTEDRFIEALKEAKFITSNTLLAVSLPDYMEISEKKDKGEKITALEQFLLDNEPADFEQSEAFRKGLLDIIRQ